MADELPTRELLEAWLSERRGTGVSVRVPQRGEKLRLLELVARNARLAYELEWKHPRRQSQEILRALRDLLDLEVEPQRIECFDISNIQGSDIVASMVVFEDGAAEEVGLPQVPDPQRVGRARRLRLDARGGGAALPAAARGGQGAARPGADRRRQGAARRRRGRASRRSGLGDQPRRQPGQAGGADLRAAAARSRSRCRAPRRCCSWCSGCATRRTASRSASTARSAARARCAPSWTTSPASGRRSGASCCRFSARVRGVRGASEAELAAVVGRTVGRPHPRSLRRRPRTALAERLVGQAATSRPGSGGPSCHAPGGDV